GEAAFRTLISVHVGLNSISVLRYGTEEQKQRYLVPQAKGEKLACFGLTEPGAGSDVAAMRTSARRECDTQHLMLPHPRTPARVRADVPGVGPQGHDVLHRREEVARRHVPRDGEQA